MRRPASLRRSAAPFALMLLATGCKVGPNFQRPTAPPAASYANVPKAGVNADRQAIVPGGDIPDQWWTLFRSPALDALVRQAIAANPDLAAAKAALRQAQEQLRADRGAALPSAEVDLSSMRRRDSGILSSVLESNAYLYNLHTAQVSVAYALDLFGGVHRQIESSAATAEAQRFQTEAAYLTLTSNVVVAAIGEASLRAQIAATRNGIAAQTHMLDIMRGRLRLGDVSPADVTAQETALAQARQALPPLEKQLAQQRDLIAVLVGKTPGEDMPETFALDGLTLPGELPLTLPARLVDQRPDIRAAEANLHATGAQVGVAIAARLPSITLSAALGGQSTALSNLFSGDNVLWAVAGGLVQPLFQGGTLLHKQHAAEAAFEQAKAQYRSTVLTAFQNVSDTLAALTSDASTLQAAETAERTAKRSLDVAQGQIRLGAIAPLQALNAEQAYWQTDMTLQQARAARYADTAALFQALGGGWWNRAPGDDEITEEQRTGLERPARR